MMRGRKWRFCSSVPHTMIVGPTIPIPKPSLGPWAGTSALANSSATTTCSIAVSPAPPKSLGQATARRPASASVARQSSSHPARWPAGSAPMPRQSAGRCSARNALIFSRYSSASALYVGSISYPQRLAGDRSVLSLEVRSPPQRALELAEVRVRSQGHDGFPERHGVLALGRLVDDGAEEARTVGWR